jgi:hypothetical protein
MTRRRGGTPPLYEKRYTGNESAKREKTVKHEDSSDTNGSSVDTESIKISSGKTETTSREEQPPLYKQARGVRDTSLENYQGKKGGRAPPSILFKHNIDHDTQNHEYLRKDCYFKEKKVADMLASFATKRQKPLLVCYWREVRDTPLKTNKKRGGQSTPLLNIKKGG